MGTDDDDYCCPVCGGEMEWVDCWNCQGDGGFHDCGEDCCCCLEPELDLNEACVECDGDGGYLECYDLPHTDEQLADYKRRKLDGNDTTDGQPRALPDQGPCSGQV